MNSRDPEQEAQIAKKNGILPLSRLRERGWGEGRGEGEATLLDRAKTMRSQQTEAEQRLWFHLRAQRFMGLKFKRQKPVGPFIVDFICLELGLIIEADGSQHGDDRDRARDDWLEKAGFVVLHFWNNDILQRTQEVLEQVRLRALARMDAPSPPAPLPRAGKGSSRTTSITINNPSPASGRGVGERATREYRNKEKNA